MNNLFLGLSLIPSGFWGSIAGFTFGSVIIGLIVAIFVGLASYIFLLVNTGNRITQ